MSCVTLVRDEVYRNYLTNCIVCNPLTFYLKYIFSLEQKLTINMSMLRMGGWDYFSV